MKKNIRQITVLALILLLFLVACRLTLYRNYQMYIPLSRSAGNRVTDTEVEDPDVLYVGASLERGRYVRVPVSAIRPGETELLIVSDAGGAVSHSLRVSRFRTVYDEDTGGFTGDNAVLIAVTLFFLSVSAIMMYSFIKARGPSFYTYTTIYYAGFSIFSLLTGATLLSITLRRLIQADSYQMMSAYAAIVSVSSRFMRLTLPIIAAFAMAMAVSNIALLRHEKARAANFLGLLVSALLLIGEGLGLLLSAQDTAGTEWQHRAEITFESVYSTVFVYFECMLTGSVICGIRAARHEPAPDKDFIIILGCWFRRDGSLPPLLRGRVDRALGFWRRQKAETGKAALFIPSGGQGRNESMAEAEAISRYLVENGVPAGMILKEDQSRNTYQNMVNSRDIISSVKQDAEVVFATTNYHVFRSGVWAGLAGLRAEGIGGPTKWWFWPNAFMRECAGLLKNRWKTELLLLMLMILFFFLLSLVLG